ncbi:MAG: hypothetical protein AAF581_08440 [Planctomycetota bacterium]
MNLRSNRETGVALLMAIVVLAALLMIGTPFVLSMRLQEEGATQLVNDERARLAAESVRNRAVARLFETHPSREAESDPLQRNVGSNDEGDLTEIVQDPANVDGAEDLLVPIPREVALIALAEAPVDEELTEEMATEAYPMRSGTDRLVAVEIEDEQGKLNINTAPPIVLGNLLGGSQLSEGIQMDSKMTEIPVVDTSKFPADDDPYTVDGVVVIMNPLIFTMEAISYRGKTDTHLTGCFRGEYLSIPQDHAKGWPIFDIRAFKVFLHRHYNLSDGDVYSYRTPQAVREIAEWSVVPYFLENIAMLGLNIRNMDDFGLTPEMLVRADLDQALLSRKEEPYDEKAFKEAKRSLRKLGVPKDMLELFEQFRGPKAIIDAAQIVEDLDLAAGLKSAGALTRMLGGGDPIKAASSQIKKELARIKKQTKDYFPRAIEAYREIYDRPGSETFTAKDFVGIQNLITTTSSIPAEWSEEQQVIGEISKNTILGFPSLQVGNYSWFNPGTLVRVRSNEDPSKVEYHIAMGAMPVRGGNSTGARLQNAIFGGGVILKDQLQFEYAEREAMVSAALRHPVNINTAPRRVLEAVMSGISVVNLNRQVRYLIDSKEAAALADLIIENRPIIGFEDLRRIVEDAREREVLDDQVDEQILLMNAQNPHDPYLSVSSVGFCYATGDVYTVESSAIINLPSGMEVANHRMREVIEVAPPDDLKIVVDGQDDWMFRMFRRQSPNRARWERDSTSLPSREGKYMITGPVPLNERNFQVPSTSEGSIRALTTELAQTPRTFGTVEHFPFELEGVTGQSASKDTTQGGSSTPSSSNPPAQPQVQDLLRQPGAVEFWVRFEAEPSGSFTLFDCASTQALADRNRVRLFYESNGQSLVFQIMDDAAAGTAFPPRGEPYAGGEIRHTVRFQPDTWYFVNAVWNSSAPGDQALFLDGRAVGDNIWVGELARTLPGGAETVVVVNDARVEWFPPKGALLVGTEVIEYDSITGNSFDIRQRNAPLIPSGRGRRGSTVQNHPVGTPVRLFGYRVNATTLDRTRLLGNALLPVRPGPNDIIVGRGEAKLDHALTPPQAVITFGGGVGTSIPYPYPAAFSWSELTTAQTTIPIATGGIHPTELGYPEQGYLQIELDDRRNTNRVIQYEYVRYSGIRGSQDPNADFEFWGCGRAVEGTDPVGLGGGLIPSFGNGGFTYFVMGVSIRADLSGTTPRNLNAFYPPAGVIQLRGIPSNANLNPVEFIYYARISNGNDHFLADYSVNGIRFRGFSGGLDFVGRDDQATAEAAGSALLDLPAGQTIIPVIAVNRPYVGQEDLISISAANPNAPPLFETRLLRVDQVARGSEITFMSLMPQSQPENVYRLFDLPEIRKFPSGGLPAESSQQILFAQAAAPTGASADANVTIDEIRLSEPGQGGVDMVPLPLVGGRLVVEDAPKSRDRPTLAASQKVIRTSFRDSDDPTSGIDKLLLVARRQLEADSDPATGTFWHVSAYPELGQFAFGKSDGLLFHDGEVIHYQNFDNSAAGDPVIATLAADLPRDPIADPNDGLRYDERDYYRTLVLPQLNIAPFQGTLPARDGFLQFINDPRGEIIYYEYRTGNTLRNVLRGQLGTDVGDYDISRRSYFLVALPTKEIDLQTRSMLNSERPRISTLTPGSLVPLAHIPVTHTTGAFSNHELPVADASEFPNTDGYLIFDDGNPNNEDEIFAVRGHSNNSFRLFRDEKTGKGIFRGRFGTPIRQQVPADLPVVFFNARYHDHYQPQIESPDLGYVQRAFRRPGAFWDRLQWQVQELRNRSFNNEVRIVARFDSVPNWDQEPTNQPGGLYLFTEPDGANELGVNADLLEIRVYFRYLPGSYGRNAQTMGGGWNDEWKHSPVLESLTVDYRKEWRIIHREELPF